MNPLEDDWSKAIDDLWNSPEVLSTSLSSLPSDVEFSRYRVIVKL
jgi:hypothetical protein